MIRRPRARDGKGRRGARDERRGRRRRRVGNSRVGGRLSGRDSRVTRLAFVLGFGAACLVVQPVSPALARQISAREGFLARVDAALASRDWKRVAAVADTASWHEAGYPDIGTLKMSLPRGPLTRSKDLSETSVLYRDGSGRSWRLTLRREGESGSWKAVIRASPCPRGGARLRPDVRPRGRPDPSPSVTTWTVLECWPLPM